MKFFDGIVGEQTVVEFYEDGFMKFYSFHSSTNNKTFSLELIHTRRIFARGSFIMNILEKKIPITTPSPGRKED